MLHRSSVGSASRPQTVIIKRNNGEACISASLTVLNLFTSRQCKIVRKKHGGEERGDMIAKKAWRALGPRNEMAKNEFFHTCTTEKVGQQYLMLVAFSSTPCSLSTGDFAPHHWSSSAMLESVSRLALS